MSTPTAPVEPSSPAKPQHTNLDVFGSAVVAGLIAIGGLLLTIYTQKPGVVVPWALCVLGLSAFAPIIPQVPRLAQVGIVFVIAVALISSSIVVFSDPKLLTDPTVRVVLDTGPTPSPPTTNIKLGPIAEPIPYCNQFLGTGTIPAGYELWIFDQSAEDPSADYYLDAQAVPAGNTWSASNIEVGNQTGSTGYRISILAVLLPASLMNWLQKTTNTASGIPSSELPPGARIVDQAVVTRGSGTQPCTQ
jgi:hypothetical protein